MTATPRVPDRTARVLAGAVTLVIAAVVVVDETVQAVGRTPPDGSGATDWFENVAFVLIIGTFPLVGWMITRRRPRNRVGWLLIAIGGGWAFGAAADAYSRWALLAHPGSLPGGLVAQSLNSASWTPPIGLTGTFLILLFPDGRLPSHRWRPLAWISALVIVVGTLGIAMFPGPMTDVLVPGHDNPLGVSALRPVLEVAQVAVLLLPACILASAVALALRFRGARGVERLQLKWFAAAGVTVALTYLASIIASLPTIFSAGATQAGWVTVLQDVALGSLALIPVAVGIAISRHGLYGIDRIINRALVVGALGAFVTAVYVAIVVGIGALVGQRQPSVALSVLATIAVAVAFQPVRSRVQRLANRLVYGRRATPYEVLSDFASRMAVTYTTGELLPRLARTVSESLGGAATEIWVRSGDRLVRDAVWPADRRGKPVVAFAEGEEPSIQADRVVPVCQHDELLGALCITKPAGEPVTPPEDALLGHVASQAGLVLRNVRLIDDLRSSRERLVTAQDHERRRLERNLHDGAQQSLVSVALLTRMAAARAAGPTVKGTLDEAANQLQRAIDELRELAHGIHPAILTERGLGPALRTLAERSAVPVTVQQTWAEERLPAQLEATLYFVAAEALTNVAKYAQARSAVVTLAAEGDELVLTVTDDGVGGADAGRGSGLRGLADRVAVVGGTLRVTSPPGHGTRVVCRAPIAVPSPEPEPVS
ncbi:MAG TPA: sensor histidine kinase [Streptosporangiales bacterium]